jgi:hypothetical protein
MAGKIGKELRTHVPFTLTGAVTGVAIMLVVVLTGIEPGRLSPFFTGFHALHVFLRAIVTASLYRRYRGNIVLTALIGYVGSIGIATLSDVIFPHHGGQILLKITGAHHHMHHLHIAFLHKWWLINPAALLGVGIALLRPTTRIPHTGHVLLSTWASLFYLVSHAEAGVNWMPILPLVLGVLFVAVWVPCCISDIIFPLLFVGKDAAEEHAAEHGDAECESPARSE